MKATLTWRALIMWLLISGFGWIPVAASGQTYPVKTGLDVVAESNFEMFKGKKVGIICNHTARDKNGNHIVDLFYHSGVCAVSAIFGPEHGFRGLAADGREIGNEIDSLTGANIFSLYGDVNKPTKEMLKNVNVLVYDIQDVGVRFYTYTATMTKCMEAAAETGIPFYVLDRPNPIRGDRIEGPMLDPKFKSFVGPHPTPIRYGLSIGEFGQLINGESYLENGVKADLRVVTMKGWKRNLWYDQTDLPWIAPSPNMKFLTTATAYPGFCLLEGTNLSEGRGTDSPFLKFGAPYIDAKAYADSLNALNCKGIRFEPITFTPVSIPDVAAKPKYENQLCNGVLFIISDRDRFEPIPAIAQILEKTKQMYPKDFAWRGSIERLYGSDELKLAIDSGRPVIELIAKWKSENKKFRATIEKYLLYK
ncbi:MAG: DUF1343 domain-containing protein [Candidatus Neomarinimicrobiota bacterium]